MFKVNNKNNIFLTWTDFTSFSCVSIVELEGVIASWANPWKDNQAVFKVYLQLFRRRYPNIYVKRYQNHVEAATGGVL